MSEMARARGLRRVVRATLGRAYPRIIGANRERSWLFYDTVLPLLGTIAFVYVYKALGAPDRFVGYVIMGGATMAFWMNVMWNMAAQFYWDKQGGNLELYMVLPCGIVPILLGMSIGGFVGTLVTAQNGVSGPAGGAIEPTILMLVCRRRTRRIFCHCEARRAEAISSHVEIASSLRSSQ